MKSASAVMSASVRAGSGMVAPSSLTPSSAVGAPCVSGVSFEYSVSVEPMERSAVRMPMMAQAASTAETMVPRCTAPPGDTVAVSTSTW